MGRYHCHNDMKLFTAFLLSFSFAIAADLPSAESLLAKSVEQSGGAAYSQLKSAQFTGKVEMAGHNITGPVSVYQKGNKSYTVIDLPGLGKVEEGFDGQTAWEMNALQGARIKEGEEKAAVERSERMNILGTWRDFYTSARTVGSEVVSGKPAWKVELTPKTGRPEFFFIDKSTGMVSRMSQTIPSAMGDIAVDVLFSDYKIVDGIQTPFTMTQSAMGQLMSMHFESAKYNAPIPDERFDLPPAVKSILDKRGKQQ